MLCLEEIAMGFMISLWFGLQGFRASVPQNTIGIMIFHLFL